MTNYNDINTYRRERNPESMRRDTLDCLRAGESALVIDACLTRSEWIENGYQLLHRLALRAAEKRELEQFLGRA